jgi:hypothetical protein
MTKNKWFVEQAKIVGVNKKKMPRQISTFDDGSFIGFE